jgi:hypothetical protein
MKSNRFHLFTFVLSTISIFVFAAPSFGQDKDWRPVTPAELSSNKPTVEPDADAEAIFWDVRVDDSSTSEFKLRHYVRAKIFTERGRERFSKYDIPFTNGTKIRDVEARVTKPDGSVVFLNKDDVVERDIIKTNGFKLRAKSFAPPGLEIGSILEFRYSEVADGGISSMRLIFQREIPLQSVTYLVKPFQGEMGMAYQAFNVGDTKFEKDKNGFYRVAMTNVPAFRAEPNMLPEDEVKKWIYIYYRSSTSGNTPDEYWKILSRAIYESSKSTLKANDEVKAATTQAIAGAANDEEKLRKIFEYVKREVRNITYAENVSEDDKKRAREIKSPSDVLKLKMATSGDIDSLFGAMARAAGFDARIALSGDRSELFFTPKIADARLVLNSSSIAVKVGTDWRFFSPASYYIPFGMLNWVEEDQTSLISDPKELIWKATPLSPSSLSAEKRTGKFKLLEDGTLVGDARIEFTGHRAAVYKNLNRNDSSAEREKTLKNLIRSNILGTAEIENFTIENVNDPEKPFVYTFRIKVPGYASRTGRRLFFQPNVFERGAKPRFVSTERKYDVYINYPWSEKDDISIELPAGFSLENADAPAPIKDKQGIASHVVNMAVQNEHTLVYKREFSFGNGGFIRFPVDSYAAIKQFFEMFNKADAHQLTLRQASAPAVAEKP